MATVTRNNRVDTLEAITFSLQSFKGGNTLYDSSTSLLGTLGYRSQKVEQPSSSTFEGFKEAFSVGADIIKRDKALVDEWSRIDFLFQLGDTEVSGIASLFEAGRLNKNEYQSFLFVAIELKGSEYKRADLVAITRELNKPFFMPVIVLFYYGDKLTLSIIDRRLHKRDSSKDVLEKVTLIRDINLLHTHRAHLEILADLSFSSLDSKQAIRTFTELHEAWKKTLSISELNKRFYRELSNWYFWASKQVVFPGAPTAVDAHRKGVKLNDLIQEHRATNVIRMLTRLLFVWFIKEKGLIPEALFDLASLQKDILKNISPYHEDGMFKESNKDSIYYKAILQNLFFATLNCPIEVDSVDKRKRGFRGDGYGTHRGIDYLMRYKQYFKNPDKFLAMVNAVVPFLNGGLFECLDDKYHNIYIDGFSDQMTQGERLLVPDYIFFGVEEKVDLSKEYGVSNAGTKKAAVKGLIKILDSYKFTITENTPIEEDVALDPELLGKVFENLLASYNPETKTTARKQTGSFYTRREIVDYMVNESLIAFLKTTIIDWSKISEHDIDKELHSLTSFEQSTPFHNDQRLQREIIEALSSCKILDPACGSGAFPMGVLQKMVHMLQKLDPNNTIWREVQLGKARSDSEAAFDIDDKQAREQRLLEINEAFDQSINDPDYARKLFLIENCIYGVDIQPIATQISKLRFFISLVVEQKVNPGKDNFGIRPLPNLETKFVAANTLVDIEKPTAQTTLYNTPRIKELETELKAIRGRLFSAKTKETKLKYREKDQQLRGNISDELKKTGWSNDAADKLASWDPYDQNNASAFFNPEWMFDLSEGFDVVIGNPPYLQLPKLTTVYKVAIEKERYDTFIRTGDLYLIFYERGIDLLCDRGHLCYITSNSWMQTQYGLPLRNLLNESTRPQVLLNFEDAQIFESAIVETNVLLVRRETPGLMHTLRACTVTSLQDEPLAQYVAHHSTILSVLPADGWSILTDEEIRVKQIFERPENKRLGKWTVRINRGVLTGFDKAFYITAEERQELIARDPQNAELIKPALRGRDLKRWCFEESEEFLIFTRRGISIEKYPVIKEYLSQWREFLEPKRPGFTNGRKPGPYKWFDIQDNVAYWRDFELPKIVWAELSDTGKFVLDESGHYPNKTLFILTGEKLKYLLGVFNTKAMLWYYSIISASSGMGATMWQKVKMVQVPIPLPRQEEERTIEALVELILHATKSSTENSGIISTFENILNGSVYELYLPSYTREAKVDILTLVAADLNKVAGRPIDERLTQLYKLWSNQASEVRNRVLLMPIRCPDTIGIIESSL